MFLIDFLSSPSIILILILIFFFFYTQGINSYKSQYDLEKLLPLTLFNKINNEEISTKNLLNNIDYILLYCSASWCPPCKQFTPILSNWNDRNANRLKAQVIFVSLDNDISSFHSYFSKMSWNLAIPYNSGKSIASTLGVMGIPALIVLDKKTGQVLTRDGVAAVSSDPHATRFPWNPSTGK